LPCNSLIATTRIAACKIIVDEPELGLHPYAITIFSKMVKQLSDEKQIEILLRIFHIFRNNILNRYAIVKYC